MVAHMDTSVFPDGASADAERCVVLAHARLSELYVQLLEHRRSLHCHVTDAFFTYLHRLLHTATTRMLHR